MTHPIDCTLSFLTNSDPQSTNLILFCRLDVNLERQRGWRGKQKQKKSQMTEYIDIALSDLVFLANPFGIFESMTQLGVSAAPLRAYRSRHLPWVSAVRPQKHSVVLTFCHGHIVTNIIEILYEKPFDLIAALRNSFLFSNFELCKFRGKDLSMTKRQNNRVFLRPYSR